MLPALMQTMHTQHLCRRCTPRTARSSARGCSVALWRQSGSRVCCQQQTRVCCQQQAARARDSSARFVLQIIRVIRHILRERRWWHLPRYTFGSSSGGVIALELPLRFPFQARRGRPKLALARARNEPRRGCIGCALCFPRAWTGKAAWHKHESVQRARALRTAWPRAPAYSL